MISIITAIHNGLEVNKLFLENLKKFTHSAFELIIVDNASTDGSTDFFRENGAHVIYNSENYSYPVSQNMGIKAATTNHLFFLNNDIIVSPQWDKHLLEISEIQKTEVLTSCGIERIESVEKSKKMRKKWGVIKFLCNWLPSGFNKFRIMHQLMYKNWELFNKKRFSDFNNHVTEGFVGNTVYIHRNALEKIGLWDERIQAADFDLYMRTKKRSLDVGDIKPCHIALGVFIHHYIRITVHSKPTKFIDADNLISLEKKWGENEMKRLLKDHVST